MKDRIIHKFIIGSVSIFAFALLANCRTTVLATMTATPRLVYRLKNLTADVVQKSSYQIKIHLFIARGRQ
ncbi:hypothetical protein LA664_02020 [Lactobacillus amylolyticus]|uniref:Uncharacterized protein n=1 Tax=Lactobacillus amylolyticus DSM 11664 TaxID=585524 RepID=D4YTR6_9LACO|nr:hypothetical protein [Lactobacillus amylolyticus]EFG55425.1 hypothetical protein HMPREF0493_0927 [Lactobacillus amylolyticus DSM 11664]QFY04144.1 hypothetical protein LA664_02020 [Lactobacillus amylolyticus]TDG62434.1 hypothetical protein C5L18_000680 [Lactobacillus amylolyticus]